MDKPDNGGARRQGEHQKISESVPPPWKAIDSVCTGTAPEEKSAQLAATQGTDGSIARAVDAVVQQVGNLDPEGAEQVCREHPQGPVMEDVGPDADRDDPRQRPCSAPPRRCSGRSRHHFFRMGASPSRGKPVGQPGRLNQRRKPAGPILRKPPVQPGSIILDPARVVAAPGAGLGAKRERARVPADTGGVLPPKIL